MPGLGQAPCFSELFVPVSCNLLQLEWQVAPKGGRKQPRVWTSMPFPFLGPSLPMPGLHQCPAPPGHVGIVLGGPSASGLAQSPRLAWKPAPVLAPPRRSPSPLAHVTLSLANRGLSCSGGTLNLFVPARQGPARGHSTGTRLREAAEECAHALACTPGRALPRTAERRKGAVS